MRSASPTPVASLPQQSNSSYRNAAMSSHLDSSVRTGSTRYALPARAASSAYSESSTTGVVGVGSPNKKDTQPTLSVPVAFSFGDDDLAPRSLVPKNAPPVPATDLLPHHGSLVLFRTGGHIRMRRRVSPGANSRAGSEAGASSQHRRQGQLDTASASSAGASIRPSVPALSLGASAHMSMSMSVRRETSPTAAVRSMSGSQSPNNATRASTAAQPEPKEICEQLPLHLAERIDVVRHARYPHYCRIVFAALPAHLPPPSLRNVMSDIESASSSDSDDLEADEESTSTGSTQPRVLGLGFESHGEMLDTCLAVQDIVVLHRADLRRAPRRTIFAFPS